MLMLIIVGQTSCSMAELKSPVVVAGARTGGRIIFSLKRMKNAEVCKGFGGLAGRMP